MDDSAPSESRPSAKRPLGARILTGPFGLRAGWRFLLFFLICSAAGSAVSFALSKPLQLVKGDLVALGETILAIAALAATWIMSRIEKKPFSSFGLGSPNRGGNLAVGLATGFLALSLLMGLLTVTGSFHLGPVSLHGSAAVTWGLFWALAFIGTGFAEELLMRGYGLFALAQGIGFWPAAVILSLLFGAGHLSNSGEQDIGIANAVLAGMVLAYSLRWSGSLWWAIGYHITWDWGETFFYGVGDSGEIAQHHFLSGIPAGPVWLSGGSVGPEGSILATTVLLLLVVAARLTTPKHAVEGLGRFELRKPAAIDLKPPI